MLPSKLRNALQASAGAFAVLGTWQLLSMVLPDAATFLPPPGQVVRVALALLGDPGFWRDLDASFFRVLAAFALASVLAAPVAWSTAMLPVVAKAVEPVIDFFRYTPVAAFVPLCILWAGIGDLEKIAVIFIGTYFQLVVLMVDALRSVPKDYTNVAHTLGASRWQITRDVALRASAPATWDALRIGLGWAWSYLVLAELVATSEGVGHRLVKAQRYLRTDEVFAGILLIGLIGALLDGSLRFVKPLAFPWLDRDPS